MTSIAFIRHVDSYDLADTLRCYGSCV